MHFVCCTVKDVEGGEPEEQNHSGTTATGGREEQSVLKLRYSIQRTTFTGIYSSRELRVGILNVRRTCYSIFEF